MSHQSNTDPFVEKPPLNKSQLIPNSNSGNIRQCRVIWFIITMLLIVTVVVICLVLKLKKNRDTITKEEITSSVTITTTLTNQPTLIKNLSTSTHISKTTKITLLPICNVTACRRIISYYIQKPWIYITTEFGECRGCSIARYPTFPSDWSVRWYRIDAYVPSSAGQDCERNPYNGTTIDCMDWCLLDLTCVGFAREKTAVHGDASAECWLKSSTQSNQIINDPTWRMFLFNSTS